MSGHPVLGARIGGIPELIEEDVNGMTFESFKAKDLRNNINKIWNTTFNYQKIAESSQKRYNSETYYNEIINIYR